MRLFRALSIFGAVALTAMVSCSRHPAPAPSPDAAAVAKSGELPRYGAVMSDVGRRFELAGRAAAANRFELAAFEVGELQELFEGDLPRAELPKEGPSEALPSLAEAFLKTSPPDLAKAAAQRDRAAFAAAFERAAGTCNGCHKASGHGFIEVPSALGRSVPDLEPLPATSVAPSASVTR
jgi:mono/diheme cytochrome c family protein